MNVEACEIARFAAAGPHVRRDVERIFWDTAGTRAFASSAEYRAYLTRWLGRYLDVCPEDAFVATRGGGVIGYLAGCRDTTSVLAAPIIADISYYTPEMLAHIRPFPAHFHVNVAPGAQGAGVGRALVVAFAAHCRAVGSTGIHVVTAADAPAAKFYAACGFAAHADLIAGGRRLCLYAMSL
jgi:GNAT superfamily N-acetyltransferase